MAHIPLITTIAYWRFNPIVNETSGSDHFMYGILGFQTHRQLAIAFHDYNYG
ncbi:Hypothetical protein FKW44_017160 [Caligus rogercresseyi]|uniref:Uncharacterized protein n=1 Tax=Caligus rogercresseyi TaxID=217165 RepID=A0A7T8K1X0_CALRO|nr:Hypothetical protein FKW44_017160 [Caligus rogercresseyi]